MTTTTNFINMIEIILQAEPSERDWVLFNDLEDYFIENSDSIYLENEAVSDLGYEMQDIIAEMEYMDDFANCRKDIENILEVMKSSI